jgi:hypothetical protein
MTLPNTHAVAHRIRALIAREDGGDVTAAARRLGLPVRDLCQVERALADDAPRPPFELLAMVAVGYGADACWLLTGIPSDRIRELSAAEIHPLAELLNAVGDRMLAARRPGQAHAALRSSATLEAAEPLPIS